LNLSHYFDKNPWRINNCSFFKGSILCKNGPLPGPYIELIGRRGSASFDLMNKDKLLQENADFLAVDIDHRIILEHRKAGSLFRPINRDIIQICFDLVTLKTPACAVNLDTEKGAGQEEWWNINGPYLKSIVESGIITYGSFCLILNFSLDGSRRQSRLIDEILRTHAHLISENLGLDEYEILPQGDEFTLKNTNHSAKVGDFEVYKSLGKKSRMVTLRSEFAKVP
jgi:hypothetical protein